MTTRTDDERAAEARSAVMAMMDGSLAGVDALSAQAFRAFLAVLRLHRQLMVKTLAAHGGHPGQAFCLRLVAAEDGVTQRDLARTLHISRPTLSRMLRTMERAGMVERRPDPGDQRLTRVYLTEGGRERERALRSISAAYLADTIGTLSENDRRELARLLDELAASMSARLEESEAAPHAAALSGPGAPGGRREGGGPAA